jgi:antitoxin (DNA-binding transcriptional repressor) of toxin-antitoxin stability system
MKQMSVGELAANLSEVIQQVGKGETIEVTTDGKVVALLTRPRLTLDAIKDGQVPDIEERLAALAQLDALVEEIGEHVTGPTYVTQMLSEMRSRLD